MDGGEENAEQLLFSQINFHIISSESLKPSDAQTVSIAYHDVRLRLTATDPQSTG